MRRALLGSVLLTLGLTVGCGGSTPPPRAPSAPQTTAANPPGGDRSIEGWDKRHPEAARELGLWVREHADAAHLFFEWDGAHTERAREFVTWGITHPREDLDVFVLGHHNWEYFDKITESHRPAAEGFLAWARRHPDAAEDLLDHPRGLEWAGDHLYAADWHMDHPRR